jgi:hypothetical protein
MPHVLRD